MSLKRRTCQFRLRTILGLWAGMEFYRADRERRATHYFQARGAYVEYEFAWDLLTPRLLGFRREPPPWLRSALGEECFTKVVALAVSDTSLGNDDLAWMSALDALRRLDLSNTSVSDAGLWELSSLKHLNTLSLHGTGVTGDGLAALTVLSQLTALALDKEQLSPAGVANVRKCSQLQSLLVFSSPELNEQQLNRVRDLFPGVYVETASSR